LLLEGWAKGETKVSPFFYPGHKGKNMEADDKNSNENVEEISKNFKDIERENEKKLLNLIVEVMVKITLKEFYETGDQVPEI
jgi:hypothetical protein